MLSVRMNVPIRHISKALFISKNNTQNNTLMLFSGTKHGVLFILKLLEVFLKRHYPVLVILESQNSSTIGSKHRLSGTNTTSNITLELFLLSIVKIMV
tara:strand:- start:3 stop:296 length:294 start_codon:yes stop_codon:yes gene_type:complete